MTKRAPANLLGTPTEKDFQKSVTELARILRYDCNHTRTSWGGNKQGWATTTTIPVPDLMLIRPPRLIFAELKVNTKVTDKQAEILERLSLCTGIEVLVWRPEDWDAIGVWLQYPKKPVDLRPPGWWATGRDRELWLRRLSRPTGVGYAGSDHQPGA